jgi:hypothetical protein
MTPTCDENVRKTNELKDEAACSGNFDLEIEKKEACCLLK